jgi:hypothetical protein
MKVDSPASKDGAADAPFMLNNLILMGQINDTVYFKTRRFRRWSCSDQVVALLMLISSDDVEVSISHKT